MEAADITLMRGYLSSIPDATHMSSKTMSSIKQNLFWALGYNTLGIPVAVNGLLAPWAAWRGYGAQPDISRAERITLAARQAGAA